MKNLLRKDFLLGVKDAFILLEIIFAIIFSVVLVLIIPKDIRTEGLVYVYDSTSLVKDFVLKNMPDIEKRKGEYYVNSREEVIHGMIKDESAIGLIVHKNENKKYEIKLLIQPYTPMTFVKFIKLEMEDFLSIIEPPKGVYPSDVYNTVRIEKIQTGLRDILPFNQTLMPPVILFMVGIMGLFVMISLLGQERSEGTICAFLVSPAKIWEMLVSKHVVLLAVGITTFSILYLPMFGFSGFFESLIIIILTIIMGSSIAVILSGFFDNPMASILWVLVIMMVLGFPAISLFIPIFSPFWLRFIPSYYTLFALDAAIFPDKNSQIIWQGILVLAIMDMVLVILSAIVFSLRVKKEA